MAINSQIVQVNTRTTELCDYYPRQLLDFTSNILPQKPLEMFNSGSSFPFEETQSCQNKDIYWPKIEIKRAILG